MSSSDQLASQALAFAVRCHAGQRRESDGEPYITHPLEVARLLRDAGCSETVVAAGLLHDVVDDADVRRPDSRTRGFLENHRELRLEHYRASLAMLQDVAPQHPLVRQLEEALQGCAA